MSLKERLHKAACRVYAWAEKHWFAKLMYPGAPAVRILDAMVGSKCKYCMAVRSFMFGAGLVLLFCGDGWEWVGAALTVCANALTMAESNFCKGD